MGEDSVDLENTARQITEAQRNALRCMEKAYYSQNGKGKINEALLREGQGHLKTMESLIQDNLQPLVQQINPASLMEKMIACGVSYQTAAHACRVISMQQASAAIGAATAAAGSGGAAAAGGLAAAAPYILAVVAAVAFAFFCYELYQWLNTPKTPPPPAVVRHYENRLNGANPNAGYKPFQGRMIPRAL